MIATAIYLLAMATTLTLVIVAKHETYAKPLVLIAVIIQSAALTWYTLSYVPGARRLAKAMARRFCSDD
jgi:hypothetical protein